MVYVLVAANGSVRKTYTHVVDVQGDRVLRLLDDESHILSIICLSPGERLELFDVYNDPQGRLKS